MGGIWRARQSLRRVTANAGNRGFIGGGRRDTGAPTFVGPNIPNQTLTVGVAWSLDARPYFTGRGAFAWTGITPAWMTVNTQTGTLSGTPTSAGSVNGRVTLTREPHPVAQSNSILIAVNS